VANLGICFKSQSLLLGFLFSVESDQYSQQPGHTLPVSLVSNEQQAGHLSPAHACADAGESEHLRWLTMTSGSDKA